MGQGGCAVTAGRPDDVPAIVEAIRRSPNLTVVWEGNLRPLDRYTVSAPLQVTTERRWWRRKVAA